MIKKLLEEIKSISRMSDYKIAERVGCVQSYICMLRNGDRDKVSFELGQNIVELRKSLGSSGNTISRTRKNRKKRN